jgi:hypothetical protein
MEKIKSLYATEKGKKYIAHLISAFLTDERRFVSLCKDINIKLRCAITSFPILTLSEVNNDKNDDKLALCSDKSSKMLSNMTYLCLKEFVAQEVLKENKHIQLCLKPASEKFEKKQQYTINVNQPKTIDVKKVNQQQPYKSITASQPKNESPKGNDEFKRATFSLGDNDVLSNLKKKLETNE